MAHKPHDNDEVYSITSARQAHTEDISHRERNYAVSMGIRTLCFVGGVIAWFHITWLGVILFIGALVLPYTSVILANAGVRQPGQGTNLQNVSAGELSPGEDSNDDVDSAAQSAGTQGTDSQGTDATEAGAHNADDAVSDGPSTPADEPSSDGGRYDR